MNTFKDSFTEDGFYLKFSPIIKSNGRWAGDIEVEAIIHDDNGLCPEDQQKMENVLHMVSASIHLYEENEEIYNMARDLVIKGHEKEDNEYLLNMDQQEEETKSGPSFTTKGNVISVGFGK
jgi:hypothetical protein|tara:strand:+ start:591 stop:953 length:363 start_codon:yes stop_codon:yes gene_type:complete